MKPHTYALDFETYYDDTHCVSEMPVEDYFSAPQAHVYMLSIVGSDGLEWVGDPHEAPWDKIAGAEWVSHNAEFDRLAFESLKPDPDVKPRAWHCTRELASSLGIERPSLKNTAKRLLGVEVDKQPRTNARGKHWPSGFSGSEQEEMKAYTLEDSRLCLKIWLAATKEQQILTRP